MAVFRCASCGSQNVIVDTQTGGIKYNFAKGAVGTVLFGTGGAVAGITNKEQRVYKCEECGIILTYPMPEDIKRTIDEGVALAERRKHLSIRGMPVSWSEIKKIYKNVESGPADETIRLEAERTKKKELRGIEILQAEGYASEEEFNISRSNVFEFHKRFQVDSLDRQTMIKAHNNYNEENLPTMIDYMYFLSELDTYFTNYFRFNPYEKPERYEFTKFRVMLWVYFALDYYEKTGLYPIVADSFYEKNETATEPFIQYILSNPFFVQLITFTIKFNSGITDEKYRNELLNDISREIHFGNFQFDIVVFCLQCPDIGYAVIPKFKIENGALYYNHLAFKPHQKRIVFRYTIDQSMEEYFTCFPEQKKQYDLDVSEHSREVTETKAKRAEIDRKKKETKTSIATAEKQLSEYNIEIELLSKKIFGKKKAEERIQEIKELIVKQKAMLEKANAEYAQLDQVIIPEPESDSDFNIRMIKKYDYFLIWYRIDEPIET